MSLVARQFVYRLQSECLRLGQSSVAFNAAWLLAGQVVSVVCQALYFLALARLLGSMQYGILAGAAALVSIVSQYSSMGSGLLLLRYVSADRKRFHELWGNVLLSTALFGMLTVGALFCTGQWIVGRESASILVILAVGDCCCGQLVLCASQVFQSFERMRITAVLNTSSNVLRLMLASAMLAHLHSATAEQWAVASLSISSLTVTAALVSVTRNFGWPRFRPRLLASSITEGFTYAVSGSTTSVYNDIDKVMLGHYGMNAANGVYSMAYRIVNICTMPIASVHNAYFPRFFREGVHGARITERLARGILQRTMIFGGLAAASMFFFSPLITMCVGKGFADSVPAIRWLCLIPLLRCFHLSAGDALSGSGRQGFRLTAQALGSAANVGMNLYLIPRYSWMGAAWASLATDAFLGLANWTILIILARRQSREPESGWGCIQSIAVAHGGATSVRS
jgi:O-antigen/teichoic acid export membrane protein